MTIDNEIEADEKKSVRQFIKEYSSAITECSMPLAVQIEEAYDEIVALQAKGIPIKQIVKDMEKGGIKVSLGYFRTVLYRIKAKRKKLKLQAQSEATTTPAATIDPVVVKPAPPQKPDQKKPSVKVEAAQGGSSETNNPVVVEKSQSYVPPDRSTTIQKTRTFDRITDRDPDDLF